MTGLENLRPPRVLYIEDSPTQAERTRALLEGQGFEVVVARDGEAGLELLRERRHDVVLSDVMMPGISGYEVCRAIKADPELSPTPVVMLTNLEDPREILRAIECGADAYLTKSYASDHLVERLQAVLSSAEARAVRVSGDAMEVRFLGQSITIRPDVEQILGLLLGTFEEHVRVNRVLEESMRRLEAQNAALMRAEELKKGLSDLVVHDLKSPTSGLLMLSQNQLRKPITEAERARWGLVYASAEVLQRMILNLLDVSRSEDGVLRPAPARLGVERLFEEVKGVLRYQLEERRQEVQILIEGGAEHLYADPDLIRRVLLNLLDNASRHAPARAVIVLGASRCEERARLWVANEGSRIPEALRGRIFEKYVRLEPGLDSEVESGRGLGLPFCRMVLQAHGGRIWVEDWEERGTSFCLELPGDGPALDG